MKKSTDSELYDSLHLSRSAALIYHDGVCTLYLGDLPESISIDDHVSKFYFDRLHISAVL